jgi:hypothetical protein
MESSLRLTCEGEAHTLCQMRLNGPCVAERTVSGSTLG